MWQHAHCRNFVQATVKLYSMHSLFSFAASVLRVGALLSLSILVGGCSGFNPSSLWPFGSEGSQGREPGPPPNATAYQCEGNRSFYLRMLPGGAAWVILPEREFRLDKATGGEGKGDLHKHTTKLRT